MKPIIPTYASLIYLSVVDPTLSSKLNEEMFQGHMECDGSRLETGPS